MKNDIKENRRIFKKLLDTIIATDSNGNALILDDGLESSINMILEHARAGGKLLFIGNGGSACIASHMAIDFWKNGGIKALAFNDSAQLTCLSNDCGYSHVFKKPIEMFAEKNDILVAISSSGKSENILQGVEAAKTKGARVITFSGFDRDNLLSKSGDINFYVPISEYGHVEILHLSLCHCMIDIIIKEKSRLIGNFR